MRRAYLLALVLCGVAVADSKLYLKSRVIDTSQVGPAHDQKRGARQADIVGRRHMLVQFDHVPSNNDVDLLVERGVAVLGYVHENGLVIAADGPAPLTDLGITWTGELDAADKVSPLLATDDADSIRPVLIELYPDIALNDARALVLDAGAILIENPDVAGRQLLIGANAAQIGALAKHDEVSYIFPAADELASGQPSVACAGALTAQGVAGQYIAKIGDGWDGPGQGAAILGYYFGAMTAQLPVASTRTEILRAFNQWARYIRLTFTQAERPDALRGIAISFGRGSHGDSYPFDGRGGALAHTFYPAPPNPEPLAGDMHFDDNEIWRIGNDTDVYSVALHEFGHALGLGHSDRPGAVMYPYYSRATTLTDDDIAAARSLYAAQVDTSAPPASPSTPNPPAAPAPPVSLTLGATPLTTTNDSVTLTGTAGGGTGNLTINWKTDRGSMGPTLGSTQWSATVPLLMGTNAITITATDARQAAATKTVTVTRQPGATPVALAITFPAASAALTTAQSFVDLRGTASHPSGIRRVTWTSDRGPAGAASGTANWDTGSVALQPGLNNITVQAIANDGSSATRAVAVNFGSAVRDTTAPAVTVVSPGSANTTTTSDAIVVRGTATDNAGVAAVYWYGANGATGIAAGTTNWSTPAIPLVRGYNSIVIRAYDAAGNMGWRVVNVTRQ